MFGNHGDQGEIQLATIFDEIETEGAEKALPGIGPAKVQDEGPSCEPVGHHVGFRHLFGAPAPHQQFRGCGLSSEDEIEATKDYLLNLSHQINQNKLLLGRPRRWENPSIPAGYTYLLQLVGHDMMHSAPSLPDAGRGTRRQVNLRRTRLELETVYGGGTTAAPHCYEVPEHGRGDRVRLKLGRMNMEDVPTDQCPFLDIPRIADASGCAPSNRGLPDVLIADPRNDDNALLSQLTTLFHHAHNIISEKLPDEDDDASDIGTMANSEVGRKFARARNVMIDRYRTIIREDLMERILHPSVYNHYTSNSDPFLDCTEDHRMPLEFAHAISRVGHAMIRPEYEIRRDPQSIKSLESVVRTTSSRSPIRMPLTRDWIVQWSLFFDLGVRSDVVNASAKINLHAATVLTTTNLFDRPTSVGFKGGGLYFRDFLRGAAARLWSVRSLRDHLNTSKLSDLVNSCELLRCDSVRERAIGKWIDECSCNYLDCNQRNCLATDPPLLFYVLLEAETQHGGRHLGVLGSIIMAETIFGALAHPPVLIGQLADGIENRTTDDSSAVFGGKAPRSMPDLVRFVAENGPAISLL